jgi:hypothetical protein
LPQLLLHQPLTHTLLLLLTELLAVKQAALRGISWVCHRVAPGTGLGQPQSLWLGSKGSLSAVKAVGCRAALLLLQLLLLQARQVSTRPCQQATWATWPEG